MQGCSIPQDPACLLFTPFSPETVSLLQAVGTWSVPWLAFTRQAWENWYEQDHLAVEGLQVRIT